MTKCPTPGRFPLSNMYDYNNSLTYDGKILKTNCFLLDRHCWYYGLQIILHTEIFQTAELLSFVTLPCSFFSCITNNLLWVTRHSAVQFLMANLITSLFYMIKLTTHYTLQCLRMLFTSKLTTTVLLKTSLCASSMQFRSSVMLNYQMSGRYLFQSDC